jgi:hypothetical protein
LLLDGVERFVIADMNLGVEVVGGDSGYGCGCVGSSGRHVWGVGMNAVFLKIKQIRAVFISRKRKEKKRKLKSKLLFYYLLFFVQMSSSR